MFGASLGEAEKILEFLDQVLCSSLLAPAASEWRRLGHHASVYGRTDLTSVKLLEPFVRALALHALCKMRHARLYGIQHVLCCWSCIHLAL